MFRISLKIGIDLGTSSVIVYMDAWGDLLLCNQSALDFFAVQNLCELIVSKRLYVLNNILLKSLIDELSNNGDFLNKCISVGLYQNSKPSKTEVKCSVIKLNGEDRQRLFVFMFYEVNMVNFKQEKQ